MAEDKKLNDVDPASDAAYVYAETSAGDQVKISKADLASVVAGVIRVPVWNGVLANGTDLNTITDGYFILNGNYSYQNCPLQASYGIVRTYSITNSDIYQECVDYHQNNGSYYRGSGNGGTSWSAWKRMDNFGNNTIEDLASSVAGVFAKGNLNINPDNIHTTSFYTIASPSSEYNLPTEYGILLSFSVGGSYPGLQIVHNRTTGDIWHRIADVSWNWGGWLRRM